MIKVLGILALGLIGVLAEPPVESSYLPPRQRSSPSAQYGTPFSNNFNDFRSSDSSSSYLPPLVSADNGNFAGQSDSQQPSVLSNTYGAPFHDRKSENFGSDSVTVDSALSTENSFSSSKSPFNYNAPKDYEISPPIAPSLNYNAPRAHSIPAHEDRASRRFPNRFGSSRPFGGITGAKFGRPSRPSNDIPSPSYSFRSNNAVNRYTPETPSNTYGAPFNNANGNVGTRFGGYNTPVPGNENGYNRQFEGYPRKATTEDPLSEPAVYEYKYEVQASNEFGTEFGHKENRENEAARGVYHVLLPDGRMQIVEYQADENGYRPQIRYEEIGYPAARSGYQEGGY